MRAAARGLQAVRHPGGRSGAAAHHPGGAPHDAGPGGAVPHPHAVCRAAEPRGGRPSCGGSPIRTPKHLAATISLGIV